MTESLELNSIMQLQTLIKFASETDQEVLHLNHPLSRDYLIFVGNFKKT